MQQGKIIGVIIARQGSSRLPGKALVQVAGKPVIGHIVERVRASKYITDVVIATSANAEDDAIEEYGRLINTRVFRGHPEDVLDRMFNAVVEEKPLAIVEVGGDCPLISPELINKGIELFYENTQVDLLTNALVPPFTYPVGYDFILLKFEALKKVNEAAKLTSERYQPFQYIIKNDNKFNVRNFCLEENYNHWRWTLDYPEDLEFVRKVYGELYEKNIFFGFRELRELLKEKKEINEINKIYAEPVSKFTAWSTGSYVEEVHADIANALALAKDLERKKNYTDAMLQYRQIHQLAADLMERAESKQLQIK